MKVLLIGATGLIGSKILHLLLEDKRVAEVKVVHRRGTDIEHPKLRWEIVDFAKSDSYQHLCACDVLINTMGTTIKAAGSKEKQHHIDVKYPLQTAKMAVELGCIKIINISAGGADASSSIFYNQLKGELEEGLNRLNPKAVVHFRPSLLLGDRKEFRLGEKIGEPFMKLLKFVPGLSKYQPIHDTTLAQAVLKAVFDELEGIQVIEFNHIHQYAAY